MWRQENSYFLPFFFLCCPLRQIIIQQVSEMVLMPVTRYKIMVMGGKKNISLYIAHIEAVFHLCWRPWSISCSSHPTLKVSTGL